MLPVSAVAMKYSIWRSVYLTRGFSNQDYKANSRRGCFGLGRAAIPPL
jgi:hypothetical protein